MPQRKRIDASTLDEVRDAMKKIDVHVHLRHCQAAIPGDPERCALVLAALEQHNMRFYVHRTVAYGRREGDIIWLRFQSHPTTRKFVEAFDRGDYSGITNGGITFTFTPPRAAIRLRHLRSEAFRKKREQSDKKRRGVPRRPYRLPDPKTLAGVRSRFGYRSDD